MTLRRLGLLFGTATLLLGGAGGARIDAPWAAAAAEPEVGRRPRQARRLTAASGVNPFASPSLPALPSLPAEALPGSPPAVAADSSAVHVEGPGSDNLTWVSTTGLGATISLCGDALTVPVQVGQQTFQLYLDTGSGSLVVPGPNVSSAGPIYTADDGTATGSSATVNYGSGSTWASGPLYADAVAIAGATMAVPTELLAATRSAGLYAPATDACAQGILGVGPDRLAVFGDTAFPGNLARNHATSRNSLSVAVCNTGGHVWFGTFNPNAALAPLQAVPLQSSNYDSVAIDALMIGTQSLAFPQAHNPVPLDTGTTQFVVPSALFAQLNQAIAPALAAFFPANFFTATTPVCWSAAGDATEAEMAAALPPLTVRLHNGVALVLPATLSYLVPASGNTSMWCPALGDGGTEGGGTSAIFGSTLMRGLVLNIDRDSQTVAWAPQNRALCPPAVG